MSLDPCCDADPDELVNCQGCGWTDNMDPRRTIPGYSISTGVSWSPGGAAFRNDPHRRFVIRLCARCAVRLALQVLEHEVG